MIRRMLNWVDLFTSNKPLRPLYSSRDVMENIVSYRVCCLRIAVCNTGYLAWFLRYKPRLSIKKGISLARRWKKLRDSTKLSCCNLPPSTSFSYSSFSVLIITCCMSHKENLIAQLVVLLFCQLNGTKIYWNHGYTRIHTRLDKSTRRWKATAN